jgi:hypothetical protein
LARSTARSSRSGSGGRADGGHDAIRGSAISEVGDLAADVHTISGDGGLVLRAEVEERQRQAIRCSDCPLLRVR